MGRQVRRVAKDWRHPTDRRGGPIPLHVGCDVLAMIRKWADDYELWLLGSHPDQEMIDSSCRTFSEWGNGPPDPAGYMPNWPGSERTHWQMYEDTTEGTPISPVCESPEELAQWLADNGASVWGLEQASREQWAEIIKQGWSTLTLTMPAEDGAGQ